MNKSAETRMANTETQAQRNTMVGPGAQAAQASLKDQVHGSRKVGSPVGDYKEAVTPQPIDIPTGEPNRQVVPEFDAGVFKEDMADSIVGQIRTNNFLNSAAAKDAMTSVQLKEIFNQFNTNKKPDPRSLVDRVVNRMGLNPNG